MVSVAGFWKTLEKMPAPIAGELLFSLKLPPRGLINKGLLPIII
jgi:hypothetical protein